MRSWCPARSRARSSCRSPSSCSSSSIRTSHGRNPTRRLFALIRASAGLNLALDYLPGSVTFDPVVEKPSVDLASRIVWFDAYVTNVDRSVRNTNMLMWHRQLWLIDHGATLYFHHSPGWPADRGRARDPFPLIKDHVLRHKARMLEEVDAAMTERLTPDIIAGIVELIPGAWLDWSASLSGERPGASGGDAARHRAAYRTFLLDRLASPRAFVEEVVRAR